MREKPEFRARSVGSPEANPERIRSDLEDRGIDPDFSRPVARRLAAIAPNLSAREYAALIDGVSAAYGVSREDAEWSAGESRYANELQRLMDGFSNELRKLDEGLQMLSTYILRMGALSSKEKSGNLH